MVQTSPQISKFSRICHLWPKWNYWHRSYKNNRDRHKRTGIWSRVLQVYSGCRDQKIAKAHPLTPHSIVSIARGPEVAKACSMTELCGLRVLLETYDAPKRHLKCERCQRFGHTHRYCRYTPRCLACGEAHFSRECSTSQQLECCRCGGKQPITVAMWNGKRLWRCLLSGHLSIEIRGLCLQAYRRTKGTKGGAVCRAGESGTWLEQRVGAVSSRLQLHPLTIVTESPTRNAVTKNRKKGKTAKSAPKVTVGLKQAPVTKSHKPAKPRQLSQPKPKELVAPILHNQ